MGIQRRGASRTDLQFVQIPHNVPTRIISSKSRCACHQGNWEEPGVSADFFRLEQSRRRTARTQRLRGVGPERVRAQIQGAKANPAQRPCEKMAYAIMTDGGKRGEIVKVCAAPSCRIHHGNRPSPQQLERERAEESALRRRSWPSPYGTASSHPF